LGLGEAEQSELTLVYDKSNNSKDNQPLADKVGLGIVGSLSPSHHSELLDIDRDQFSTIEGRPGNLAYRTTKEVLRPAAHDHRLLLGVLRARAAALIRRDADQANRELDELKGIVERGKHRMDERALQQRIKGILKRRCLEDVITITHDLATNTFIHRTGPESQLGYAKLVFAAGGSSLNRCPSSTRTRLRHVRRSPFSPSRSLIPRW
jgi:hypothetical protein